jgi:hypothetical protein
MKKIHQSNSRARGKRRGGERGGEEEGMHRHQDRVVAAIRKGESRRVRDSRSPVELLDSHMYSHGSGAG